MKPDLSEPARKAIAVAMRTIIADVSEYQYAAGWMDGIEYTLWDAVQNGGSGYYGWGQGGEDVDLVPVLRELSTLIDGWVTYHGYVPMADWPERLAARSGRPAAG